MPQASVNGVSLEYFERGRGRPLVLVHGSASDYRTWEAALETFGERYRTIAYSRRYHWPNAKIPEDADYSMPEHVDDLRALMISLDATPAHLVGHSYGAFVSLLLAIREPEMVRSLVLVEPPVVPLFVSNVPEPAQILKLLFTRPRTAVALIKFGATGVTPANKAAQRGDTQAAMRIFGKAVLGPAFYRRLSESRMEQVLANAIKAEFLGSGFPPLSAEEVRDVQTPVLLIAGRRSPAIFRRLIDRLEELLPNAERVEIENASHIVHEDNPTAYYEAVGSFLEKQDRAA